MWTLNSSSSQHNNIFKYMQIFLTGSRAEHFVPVILTIRMLLQFFINIFYYDYIQRHSLLYIRILITINRADKWVSRAAVWWSEHASTWLAVIGWRQRSGSRAKVTAECFTADPKTFTLIAPEKHHHHHKQKYHLNMSVPLSFDGRVVLVTGAGGGQF